MLAGYFATLLPRTLLGQVGWFFEFAYIAAGFTVFWRFRRRNSIERGADNELPDADAIRNHGPETLAKYTNRPILAQMLRTLYSRRGYIQEEEVVATVEEKVMSRGDSLRDWAALSILTALLFTFLTLYFEVRSSAASTDHNARLTAVFDLVGVNWPGILAGLICTVLAAVVRYQNISLLSEYRRWLDVDIFPNLSAARTTVDQLGKLTEELKGAVDKLSTGLQPLAQLPMVLSRFQTDVIGGFVPKLVEGIQSVPVSFSDTTVQQLRKMSGDSTKLIAQVTRDYGKLVLLSEQSERRQTEIAAGVAETVTALQELRQPVTEVASVLRDNRSATESVSLALVDVQTEIRGLRNEIPSVATAIGTASTDIKALAQPIDRTSQALNEIHPDLQSITVAVGAFTSGIQQIAGQITTLGEAVSEMLPEMRAYSSTLSNSTAAVATGLTSFEGEIKGSVADARVVASSILAEARSLDGTLTSAQKAVSHAEHSLVDSVRDLFDNAQKAREVEEHAMADAGLALQAATAGIEKTITHAARTLAAALGEAGELAEKYRGLELAMSGLEKDIGDVDRNTRGGSLLRRIFNAGRSR